MKSMGRRLMALGGLLLCLTAAERARAQDAEHVSTEPPPRRLVVTQETNPSAELIGSGLLMFGLSYGGSILAAVASDEHADRALFVPIAGPWLDLADRGSCPPRSSCRGETAAKALLAADGVVQTMGALGILAAFLFPETRTVTRVAKAEASARRVTVLPSFSPSSVGLSARGAF